MRGARRLSDIIGRISREVYTIKHIPKPARIAAALRLGQDLHDWRASLPAHLGNIKPSSLVPSFRRQVIALRLAYSHAVMHNYRPFLLREGGSQSEVMALKTSVTECMCAAKMIVETVDDMAKDGTLFHAFWWTHYVTFCALAVVYVWELQHNSRASDTGSSNSECDFSRLLHLAERCQSHLAQTTAADSPSQRYSVILEELRIEARRQSCSDITSSGINIPVHSATSHLTSGDFSNDQTHHLSTDPDVQSTLLGNGHSNMANFGLHDMLNGWQTTDWLDLDSSVRDFSIFAR